MISNVIILVNYVALLFFAAYPGSQRSVYYELYVEPQKISRGQFKGFSLYELNDFNIYHGTGGKKRDIFINRRNSDSELFHFQDTISMASDYNLKFFLSSEPDLPVVVMMSVENEVSLGQHIFRLTGNSITHSGFIHYAADDYNFSSLAYHAHIEEVEGRLLLSFNTESIIDYSLDSLLNGRDVKFEILRQKVIRIQ
jgi:hypothetical protein